MYTVTIGQLFSTERAQCVRTLLHFLSVYFDCIIVYLNRASNLVYRFNVCGKTGDTCVLILSRLESQIVSMGIILRLVGCFY